MNLAETKALIAVLFCIIRFSFGILPIKIYKFFNLVDKSEDGAKFINSKREAQIMCGLAMFQSFGGGVLFATCFVHMMAELYFALVEILQEADMSIKYPYSQLIVSFGFFLVYFLEETGQWIISRIPDEPIDVEKYGHRKWCKGKIEKPSSCKIYPEVKEKEPDDKESMQVTVIEDLMNQNEVNSTLSTPKKNGLDKLSTNDEDTKTINSQIEELNELNLELNLEVGKTVNQIEQFEQFLVDPDKSQQQLFRGCLIIFALCLHSLFEGLAIGLQMSIANILYLFVAISIHSATVLFCISLEFLMARKRCKTIIYYVTILSISSPIGVFLGLLLSLNAEQNGASRSHNVTVVLLEGISTGTILYITFFEVLNKEKERGVYRMRRALCILLGFSLMAILEIFEM